MRRRIAVSAAAIILWALPAPGQAWQPVSPYTSGAALGRVRFGYLHWSAKSGDKTGDRWDVDNSFGEHNGKTNGGPRPEQFALWGLRHFIEWDFTVPKPGDYVVTVSTNTDSKKGWPVRIAYRKGKTWIESEPVLTQCLRGWDNKLVSWRIKLPAGRVRLRLRGNSYAWWAMLAKPWESKQIKNGRVVKLVAREVLGRHRPPSLAMWDRGEFFQRLGPDAKKHAASFLPNPRAMKEFRETLGKKVTARGWDTGSRHYMANTQTIARWYVRSGDEDCAKLVRDRILKMIREPIFNQGSDDHMALWRLWHAWILVEPSPSITRDNRRRIANFFLRIMLTTEGYPRLQSWYWNNYNPSTALRHNHQTVNALGVFLAGDYFKKHYKLPLADLFLERAREICRPAARTFKPAEDSNNYEWHTVEQTALWSLWSGDGTYLKNGNFGRAVDRLMLCLNNFGTPANFGDCWEPFECINSQFLLEVAARTYRKGRYQFALDLFGANHTAVMKSHYWHKLRRLADEYYFRRNIVRPEKPKDLLGIAVAPLAKPFYDHCSGANGDLDFWRKRAERPPNPPLERCYDKLSLRRGFGTRDEYLLLQGIGYCAHGHHDANAIVQLCANDRIFLIDLGYQNNGPEHHSMLEIVRDGTPMWPRYPRSSRWAEFRMGPTFCELLGKNETEAVGLLSSKLSNVNGADWTRHLVWLKGRGVLVLDEVVIRKAGEYTLTNRWRVVGACSVEGRTLTVNQGGEALRIVNADGSALSLKAGRAGAPYKYLEQSYRWASKHPWVWEQRGAGKLAPGDRRLFVNLLAFGKEKLPVGEIREKGRGWTVGGVRVALSGGRVLVVTGDGRTLRLK